MYFPVSGVEVSPLVPPLVGFVLAALTTPVGVSGAFLLLPFQVSVLGFVTPGVTPTNLLFNVISTPGGISGYGRQGSLDRKLVVGIVAGAVPGIILGSFLRVTVLAEASAFKTFAGIALIALGLHLLLQSRVSDEASTRRQLPKEGITILAAAAGTVGGIYGISGGSLIAPALVGVFGVTVRSAAPAALVATLITSSAGVISFLLLDAIGAAPSSGAAPDWALGVLFGIGGAAGGRVGARLNQKIPERGLRGLLGTLAVLLGLSYVATIL